MEFDFTIEFKQGRENLAVDALSRQQPVDYQAITTLTPESTMLNRIINSWQVDLDIKNLIQDLQTDASLHKNYTWRHGELKRKR